MQDRGVSAERIGVILAGRARIVSGGHALPPMVTPPDPNVANVPPYGVPPRAPAAPPPPPEPVQEALF